MYIVLILIIYRPGARRFGEIFPEVMTEGNISPNPPSGESIDVLYRK